MNLLLGLDGGGSKTLALLADADGRLLGRGTAGASNYQGVGAPAAQAALEQAIAAAFVEAGLSLTLPQAACFGLAGVGRPEDKAMLRAWLDWRLPGVPVAIVNDAELILAAGTPAGWGVGLICGTGSIALGRAADGRMARAGGWGYLLGDEGSGYDVGRAALRAVMRSYDGRNPQTALTPAVLAHWGLTAPPDLVTRVYQPPLHPADLAALAMVVETTAAQGDEVARGILREAGGELALAARAVIRGLNLPEPTPCALAGGVIIKGQAMQALFLAAAEALGLQLDPVTPVVEPAQGALRLARWLVESVESLSPREPGPALISGSGGDHIACGEPGSELRASQSC